MGGEFSESASGAW